MATSNCCFLICIQISQEADQVVWYSHLFQNFPQFIVIHTVKGFGIINKAEIDIFLELSCFFDDPVDVGNLISGSSSFSKTSLNIRKFTTGNKYQNLLERLWPPHAKSWLIGKDSDAGRDWGQEEKGTTEDEMAGWHHWLDGHVSQWTLGVGDGKGGLVCCDSWGRKESDTTERLIWSDLTWLERNSLTHMELYSNDKV